MAKFRNDQLSVISFANGFTLWQYADRKLKYNEFLSSGNLFGELSTMMNIGDKILINLEDAYTEVVVVSTNSTNKKVSTKEIVMVRY